MIRSFTLALGLAALGNAAVAQQAVRIGAVLPLSGPNSSYGDVIVAGANLAVEHVNADKMLAAPLAIAYEDSQALPQQGVIAMNKLVNLEKVPFVLSSFTGVSKAISVIGERSKTVVVNGGATGPDLAKLGDYFWNMIPLINFEARALLPYLTKDMGIKTLVMVHTDEPGAQSTRQEIEASTAQGGTLKLVGSLSIPPSQQQFSGIAAKVRDLKPDAVFIASTGAQQAQLTKQLRENGVNQQIVSTSVYGTPEILAMPEAKGALYTTQSVNFASKDPVTQRFVQSYKAKYDKLPSVYTVNYYNAVLLFGILASELQKKGKPVTGENLLAQRKETREFDLVGGRVSFEANGTIKAPIQVNAIDGQNTKIVSTVPAP